jgi:hypothetical protein
MPLPPMPKTGPVASMGKAGVLRNLTASTQDRHGPGEIHGRILPRFPGSQSAGCASKGQRHEASGQSRPWGITLCRPRRRTPLPRPDPAPHPDNRFCLGYDTQDAWVSGGTARAGRPRRAFPADRRRRACAASAPWGSAWSRRSGKPVGGRAQSAAGPAMQAWSTLPSL